MGATHYTLEEKAKLLTQLRGVETLEEAFAVVEDSGRGLTGLMSLAQKEAKNPDLDDTSRDHFHQVARWLNQEYRGQKREERGNRKTAELRSQLMDASDKQYYNSDIERWIAGVKNMLVPNISQRVSRDGYRALRLVEDTYSQIPFLKVDASMHPQGRDSNELIRKLMHAHPIRETEPPSDYATRMAKYATEELESVAQRVILGRPVSRDSNSGLVGVVRGVVNSQETPMPQNSRNAIEQFYFAAERLGRKTPAIEYALRSLRRPQPRQAIEDYFAEQATNCLSFPRADALIDSSRLVLHNQFRQKNQSADALVNPSELARYQ